MAANTRMGCLASSWSAAGTNVTAARINEAQADGFRDNDDDDGVEPYTKRLW